MHAVEVVGKLALRRGYRLGFTSPTAVQRRNPHDLMADFESEIPMYRHAARVHEIVEEALLEVDGAPELDLLVAYLALAKRGVVDMREINRVSAWLSELKEARA